MLPRSRGRSIAHPPWIGDDLNGRGVTALSLGAKPSLLTRRLVFGGLTVTAMRLAVPSARAEIGSERADRVIVLKSERKLLLLRAGAILRSFPIALGACPEGPKRFEGDSRTPEGFYRIDAMNPRSQFRRALHISYPNAEDVRRAREVGMSPGGNIAIHGLPTSYGDYDPIAFFKDWTEGCIAVGNLAIEQIWERVSIGTPVEIRA